MGKHVKASMSFRYPWLEWLIPLTMLLPVAQMGSYGLGYGDILLVVGGGLMLLQTGVPLPRSPITIYLVLFFLGWFFSALDGLCLGIRFEFRDMIIFYRLFFCWIAWTLGYKFTIQVERMAVNRITVLCIAAVAGIAIAYTFLPHGQRVALLSHFRPIDDRFVLMCYQNRFPGVNAEVNIYSFLPLIFFLFSLSRLVDTGQGLLTISLSSIIIVALGSRTTALSALICVAVLLCTKNINRMSFAREASQNKRILYRFFSVLAIILMLVGVAIITSGGYVDNRLTEKTAEGGNVEDADYRFRKWSGGMRRIALSPFLGFPDPTGDELAEYSYYYRFKRPHNEFLQIWMWYGVLGLFAHIYLLYVLISRNISCRSGAVWWLFYIFVIIRMMTDTAFKNYQFSMAFFLIAGSNWSILQTYYLGQAKPSTSLTDPAAIHDGTGNLAR